MQCVRVILLSLQVGPKNPSLHKQTKVSTLTSMQEPPFLHGELLHASVGAMKQILLISIKEIFKSKYGHI